jgi:pimeloyl-ACP methyl ester carboxylesterase
VQLEQALQAPAFDGAFELVDGLELFVRRSDRRNDDLDVLMVHGLGGLSINWTDLMHLQVARGRRVAALDLPGFGRSDPDPDGDYSIARHARAVIALLETTTTPTHLVGNSLGGAIVTTVAALRPDLVRTLTLITPALPHVRPGLEKLPILMGVLPRAADLLGLLRGGQTPEERVAETTQLVFADPNRAAPHRIAEAVHEQSLRADLPHIWHAFVESSRGLGRAFLPWGEDYLWRRLDNVQAPVLAIFGTHDRLVDAGIATRVAGTINGGTVVVLPGVGHVPQMEVPLTVDRLLDAHIDNEL